MSYTPVNPVSFEFKTVYSVPTSLVLDIGALEVIVTPPVEPPIVPPVVPPTVIPTISKNRTVLVEFTYISNSVVYTERLSNNGYTTASNDSTNSNKHFKGLLIGDPFMSCGFDEPLGIGNLKLKNMGELDKFMTDCAAEGRDIYIYTGNQSQDCSEFTQIFKGITGPRNIGLRLCLA